METIGLEQFKEADEMIAPEDYLRLLYEHCENGVLLLTRRDLPPWISGKDAWTDAVYRCSMRWDQAAFQRLLDEFAELKFALGKIAEYGYYEFPVGEDEAAQLLKDSELLQVWKTYLKPYVIGGHRKERKTLEKELLNAWGYKRDSAGDEIWPRVKESPYCVSHYMSGSAEGLDPDGLSARYGRAVAADIRHRVGDTRFAQDLISSARYYWGMCYFLHQESKKSKTPPEYLQNWTKEYACGLAENLALHRFCVRMESEKKQQLASL